MYWFYNVCLVAYWFFQVPVLLYRLIFEDGFYDRLKQSAGIMPTPTLEQIAYHNAIWIHAASVGEVVAASPIVRELKNAIPKKWSLYLSLLLQVTEWRKGSCPRRTAIYFFLLICLLSQNEL